MSRGAAAARAAQPDPSTSPGVARFDGLHLKLRKTAAGRYALGVDFELADDGLKLEEPQPGEAEPGAHPGAPQPRPAQPALALERGLESSQASAAEQDEEALALDADAMEEEADDGEEAVAVEDEGDEDHELRAFASDAELAESTETNRWPNQLPVPDGILEISQAAALFEEADDDAEARDAGLLTHAAEAAPAAAVNEMLAEARKSIGLGESPPGSNHNKITVWYNKNIAKIGNGPWCNMAVTYWAGCSSNLPAILAGKNVGYAYTVAHAQKFKKKGRWHTGVAGIKAGDIVFFDWKGSHSIARVDHVGIVEKVQGKKIITIEGNTTGDRCRRVVRDAKYIVGYGRPTYGQ